MNLSVEREIVSLPSKTLPELKKMWKELFKSAVPPYCKEYLIPRIAYRLQEIAYDKLSTKRLDNLADQLEQGRKINSNNLPIARTKLIREYNGKDHEVLVTDTGFIYQGQYFTSLSPIAVKITGTSWNGPKFFGLRNKSASLKEVNSNV